jgi:hypothetical protein
MNGYRLRTILDFIRSQGKLPCDQWGNTLSPDDLLVWFGLKNDLTPEEQREVKRELAALVEAEALMDRLRLGGP